MGLTFDQCYNLESEFIRALIAEEVISIDQALGLSIDQQYMITQPDNMQGLRNGVPFDQFIQRDDFPAAAARNIGGGQSTHTASVHQSVSESAANLHEHYKSSIDGDNLETEIELVKAYVHSLSSESLQHQAAKRCVVRITAPVYTFTDPGSEITTKQLLALAFLATGDDERRIGRSSREDARKQFIEGLYEMQRGYNLSDTNIDDGHPDDRTICCAGTFNKFIEKLQGIHQDCQINFITHGTASLKLPIVVHNEAMRYLESFANPKTAADFTEFNALMGKVKKDGVDVIWGHIKDDISRKMYDEFKSVYPEGPNDKKFNELIDAGMYTELKGLSEFQEQVQSPTNHHQSSIFLPHEDKKSANCLWEHRQDSPKDQNEYDKQFGLQPTSQPGPQNSI